MDVGIVDVHETNVLDVAIGLEVDDGWRAAPFGAELDAQSGRADSQQFVGAGTTGAAAWFLARFTTAGSIPW